MNQGLFRHILLGILVGLAATWAACGGAGGSAAPPVSGGVPVAVEIPALGEVSGLPFASTTVVSASGNIAVALKATPSSWVGKSFDLISATPFVSGDSRQACEYRNMASNFMGTWAKPDQVLCNLKENISSVTNPYNGEYHIVSTGAVVANIPSKYKFKIKRNSSNLITDYEAFICDGTNTQISYAVYSISGSTLTATLKTIVTEEPQRKTIEQTCTLKTSDPTKCTAKSGTVVYTGSSSGGALQGKIAVTQGTDYLLQNGFDSRGAGSNVIRLYGQADMSNSSSPFAISGYTFGAGAAVFVDNGASSEGCWNTSNRDTTCSGTNFTAVTGKTALTESTQTISDFSDNTKWNCSGTAEVTVSSSSSTCFTLYDLNTPHIDCVTAISGDLTVTPSVGGTTLSTNSGSPTTGVSATPSIVLTSSRALDSTSVNSTTVTLINTATNDAVTLTYEGSQMSSNGLTYTFTPTLTSGQTYKLTLVGSSTTATSGTVIRAPGADPPKDQLQSTGTYYITAQ